MMALEPRYRESILRRDHYKCTECGKRLYDGYVLHVHHKIPSSQGGSNDPENLVTVCPLCHQYLEWKYWDDRGGYSRRPMKYKSKMVYLLKKCEDCEHNLDDSVDYPINPHCLDCAILRRVVRCTRPNPEAAEHKEKGKSTMLRTLATRGRANPICPIAPVERLSTIPPSDTCPPPLSLEEVE